MSKNWPRPATFRRTSILVAALLAAAGLALANDQEPGAERLLVPKSELARQPLGSGERVLEDYGDTVLIESGAMPRLRGVRRSLRPRLAFVDYPFDPAARRHVAHEPPARLLRPRSHDSAPALHVVAFHGPIKDAWLDALRSLGAETVRYLPENAYIVRVAAEKLPEISALTVEGSSPVTWVGYFQPAYRIARSLIGTSGEQTVRVLFQDTPRGRLLAQVVSRRSLALAPLRHESGFLTTIVRAPAEWLEAWAAAPGVYRIEPWVEPKLAGEVGALNNAGQRVNGNVAGAGDDGLAYLDWLEARGFDTESIWSFGVNVSDTGLDKGNGAGSWHPDLYGPDGATSRVLYAKDWTTEAGSTNDGVDIDGHGTNCAGVVGGYNDDSGLGTSTVSPEGYRFGLGVAPNVQLGGSKIFDSSGSWDLTANYEDIEEFAHEHGVRISSNSWGGDRNDYTWDASIYDGLVRDADPSTPGNQEMVILFAAGNAGPGANSVGTPGNAKNVITLAAAENWWPGYSACGWPTSYQDSPGDDIVSYSGRGPTADGRIKPDLAAIAHGWVTTRGSQAGTGCGNPYAGADTLLYRSFNGTSAATPAAAGSAALFYQHILQNTGSAPSPALVKAALVATARDLVGGNDGGTGTLLTAAPNSSQGWGLIDVGTLFDEASVYRFDQQELFDESGETWTVGLGIASTTRPVKVVLAWTDAPGNTAAAPWMNDLDLEVFHDGSTYLGNVMSGGYSITGGLADGKNNLEVVHLPAGSVGGISVRVRATNIVADGVPGEGDLTDQDFAIYVYNATNCSPLEAPTDVIAQALSDQSIAIDWTSVEEASAYRVYRAVNEGDFAERALVAAPQSAFLDEQVPSGATYTYMVRSVNGCESEDSPYASATPAGDCVLPPSFGGVTSVADAESSSCALSISWAAGASHCGGSVYYDVHRSSEPAFVPSHATRVASGIASTSYLDSSALVSGEDYVYLVRAVDASNGVQDDNSVKLSASATGGVFEALENANLTIPFINSSPITSVISVGQTGEIVDLNAGVHIDHAASEELVVTLESPSGTSVTLHDRRPADPDGIDTVYDRDTLPFGPGSLDDFDGEGLGGSWTMGVSHPTFGPRGTLVSWSIEAELGCSTLEADAGESSASGQTRVSKGLAGILQVHFQPAPLADDHRVYVGRIETPGDAPSWDAAFCALPAGLAEISPSEAGPGVVQLLLPAGAASSVLGSLGQDSAGAERPDSGLPSCPVALLAPRATPRRASTLVPVALPEIREERSDARERGAGARALPLERRALHMRLGGRRLEHRACP